MLSRALVLLGALAGIAGAEPRTLLQAPARVEEPRGVWLGPVFVEGKNATLMRKLPGRLLRALAIPFGVGPMGMTGASGFGVFGRFGS